MRSTDQLNEYDNNGWPQQPGYHDQKNQPSDKSKKKSWLEREVKLMSAREECDYYTEYEDDYTCPLGFVIVKYFLVIVLVIFFIIIPAIMIYVGISFGYCQDIFSAWLLVGGVLCYLDFLILLSKWPLKKYCGINSTYVYYVFLFWLAIILLWWVFGFGRIFSGAMNQEPIMSDDDCKKYLYTFPFWLCLSPFLIFFIILFIFCCHNC